METTAFVYLGVGHTGPAGIGDGVTGPTGSSTVGDTGPTGASVVGHTGPTGSSSGMTGPTGASTVGDTGPTGSGIGSTGATGPDSETGPTGPPGEATIGPTGDSGPPGVGPTGETGPSTIGEDGETGPTGIGDTGPTGSNLGPTGPTGESIVGDTGPTGSLDGDGETGPTGPIADGVTGPTGPPSDDVDTPGPTGEIGETGPTGPPSEEEGPTGETGPPSELTMMVNDESFVDPVFGGPDGLPETESAPFETIEQALVTPTPLVTLRSGTYDFTQTTVSETTYRGVGPTTQFTVSTSSTINVPMRFDRLSLVALNPPGMDEITITSEVWFTNCDLTGVAILVEGEGRVRLRNCRLTNPLLVADTMRIHVYGSSINITEDVTLRYVSLHRCQLTSTATLLFLFSDALHCEFSGSHRFVSRSSMFNHNHFDQILFEDAAEAHFLNTIFHGCAIDSMSVTDQNAAAFELIAFSNG